MFPGVVTTVFRAKEVAAGTASIFNKVPLPEVPVATSRWGTPQFPSELTSIHLPILPTISLFGQLLHHTSMAPRPRPGLYMTGSCLKLAVN